MGYTKTQNENAMTNQTAPAAFTVTTTKQNAINNPWKTYRVAVATDASGNVLATHKSQFASVAIAAVTKKANKVIAERPVTVTPADVAVVAPLAATLEVMAAAGTLAPVAVSPRQRVAAEIQAAAQHLNETLLTGDILDIELAEGRVYRASIAQVLTHVSHHGQRCAVLAIAGTLLTVDYNGQPVEVRSGSLLVAGFEFEAYEQPRAASVELAAAVAQQQRAQNATRVSDEVKTQLLNAAAKRLARAQAASI